MTTQIAHAANPFQMMLDPQTLLDAIERSDDLAQLSRRICRPLERPMLPHRAYAAVDLELDADDSDDLDYVPFDESDETDAA